MVDAFTQEVVTRRRKGGPRAVLAFAVRACIDSLVAGWGERRRHAGPVVSPLAGLRQDILHAVRSLSRSWIFTGVSLLSLSCGIGIAMALFLLLRQTLQPPFPIEKRGLAEVIVREDGRNVDSWSYPDFEDVRASLESVQIVGWSRSDGMLQTGGDESGRQIRKAHVSLGYFELLGQTPQRGRALAAGDVADAGVTPVVVTESAWRSWFAADPEVIGRSVTIDGAPHVVVGVAPPYFRGHGAGLGVHVFLPLERHPFLTAGAPERFDRDTPWVRVLARTREGASLEDARESIASAMAGLAAAHPETNAQRSALTLPYAWQGAEPGSIEGIIIRGIFSGIQLLVLLVVALNIGGMVLVRSAMRERELAMRMAIGSSRWRLVRYLLAESLVIGVAGGALVVAVLQAGVAYIARGLETVPQNIVIDLPVMATCLGLSVVTAVAFGLVPAMRFSRASLVSSMRDGAGRGGRRSGRVHRLAVAGQLLLAVPVLIVAGSVTRGAQSMTRADYGVESDGLLVAERLELAPQGYAASEVQALARSMRENVAALAGVTDVSVSDQTPLNGRRASIALTSPATGSTMSVRVSRVDERFFATMDIPITRGRAVSGDDVAGADPVAVVTASLAERLFGADDPLGQRLQMQWGSTVDGQPDEVTVIGVSEEVSGAFLESDTDNVFLSYWQHPTTLVTVATRTPSHDEALSSAIGAAIVASDPDLAAPAVHPFSAVIEYQGRDMPIWSVFFTTISTLLLGLCALGIYGIVAFSVASRTREIGVRMSLGATDNAVLTGVIRDALRIAAPGLAIGSIIGMVIGQRILNQMYAQIGLPMANPAIVLAAVGGALGVVLVASLSPARRAARVDPMEALRAE